jgi:hypothetical protein
MSSLRGSFLLISFVGISLLVGCGAVFVNEGSKNANLAEGIANPSANKPKINVPPDQRIVCNFEDGSNSINPKLFGGATGNWIDYGGADGTPPSPNFVVAGGANGTKMAAHIFGVLIDHGDGKYPEMAMEGNFNKSGNYDASAFTGVKFYYKCPIDDQAKKRRFVVGTAPTLTTAEGGTCTDQCDNHFGNMLETENDWVQKVYNFSDLKRESGWGSAVTPPDLTDHLKEFVLLGWKHSGDNNAGTYTIDFWVDEIEFY